MSERMQLRERAAWLALVAALTTALGWIAVLGAVALLQSHALLAPALVLLRALARAGVALALHAWPILPLAVLGSMMLALAMRPSAPARRKVRHA